MTVIIQVTHNYPRMSVWFFSLVFILVIVFISGPMLAICWTYFDQLSFFFVVVFLIFNLTDFLLFVQSNYHCLVQLIVFRPHSKALITHTPLQIYHKQCNDKLLKTTICYTKPITL